MKINLITLRFSIFNRSSTSLALAAWALAGMTLSFGIGAQTDDSAFSPATITKGRTAMALPKTPPDDSLIHVANTALEKTWLDNAREEIRAHGDKISPEAQQSILQQKIAWGMTPYECSLAAGAFQYGVQADPKWPANTDPRKIMWMQSITPDDSKIFMIFQTGTQYPAEGLTFFRVDFEHGIAVKIAKQPAVQSQ